MILGLEFLGFGGSIDEVEGLSRCPFPLEGTCTLTSHREREREEYNLIPSQIQSYLRSTLPLPSEDVNATTS